MQCQRRGRVLRVLDGLPAVVLLAQRERARPRRRPLAAPAARRHLLCCSNASSGAIPTLASPSIGHMQDIAAISGPLAAQPLLSFLAKAYKRAS